MNPQLRLERTPMVAESPASAYAAAIRKATDRASLLRAIRRWYDLAADAYAQAESISWESWEWAKKHARSEKHAVRVSAIAGHILCPTVMMHLDLLAMKFKAPWGVALHQAHRAGVLRIDAKAFVLADARRLLREEK